MFSSRRLIVVCAVAAAMLAPQATSAQALVSLPNRDTAGAADNPLLRRYDGSFIVDFDQKAFDEFQLPTGALQPVPDKRDAKNNRFYAPETSKALEGKKTRLVYVVPAGRSPLEVMRNYEDEVTGKGGEVLFKCRAEECGGDNSGGIDGGGGDQSLLMKIFPVTELRAPYKSAGHCAMTSKMSGLRYTAMRLPANGGDAHVAVVTFTLSDTLYCKVLNEHTIVVVTIVEPRAREQRMVTIRAEELNSALNRDGRIVLHNILFDFDKADIKPESLPQLQEIAILMKANPNLRLNVVGHTDNQGQVAYNMDLSRRRAQAVAAALAQNHGIAPARLMGYGVGPLAPVASNADEAGRARNRRTELVPQ